MSNKANEIIGEYARLDAARTPILRDFQDISRYVLPSHAYFTEQKVVDGNSEKQLDVFDSTAMRANEVLANFLHSAVTPDYLWALLRMRDKDLDKAKSTREYFETQQVRIFEALRESNFVTSIAQLYLDLGAFNTAAIHVDRESSDATFGKLKFTNIHLKKLVFKEGTNGRADYVMVKELISAINAVDLYPDADMPKVKAAVDNGKDRHKEFEFIISCEPKRQGGEVTGYYETTIVSVEDKTVAHTTIDEKIPYMVPRWQQAAGQVWGTGPGMRSLPDCRVINRAKELELSGWEQDINEGYKTTPDNLVDDELFRTGVTIVKDVDKLRALREGQISWQVAQIKGEEIQNSIRSMFYEDRLVMQSSGGDTATEFKIRYDLLQRQLAPTAGRLTVELLNPLIERVFTLMLRGGALDDLPPELAGKEVDIEYVSPLSKAQGLPQLDSYERWLGLIMNTAQMYPEVRHLPDIESGLRNAADVLDVPSDNLKSEKEYASALQAEQEAMQQQQQAMQQQEQEANGPPQQR